MEDWFNAEKIFSNNGEKIKKWARGLYIFYLVVYLLAGVASIIVGFSEIDYLGGLIFVGMIELALAQPLAYLSTCFIHGFGELIENSDILVKQRKSYVEPNKEPVMAPAADCDATTTAKHRWRCPTCNNMISEDVCPICNKK